MIFARNPEMENAMAVYSDDEKWSLMLIKRKEGWVPAKWVIKNDKKINKQYIISDKDVPNGVMETLIKIPFLGMDFVENFKNILR